MTRDEELIFLGAAILLAPTWQQKSADDETKTKSHAKAVADSQSLLGELAKLRSGAT